MGTAVLFDSNSQSKSLTHFHKNNPRTEINLKWATRSKEVFV